MLWGYWFSIEDGNLTVWPQVPSVHILLYRNATARNPLSTKLFPKSVGKTSIAFIVEVKATNKWSMGDCLNYMQPHWGDHREAKNRAAVARWNHVKWKSPPNNTITFNRLLCILSHTPPAFFSLTSQEGGLWKNWQPYPHVTFTIKKSTLRCHFWKWPFKFS